MVYLGFTAGYAAGSGADVIRVELAGEAIRLARLLRKLLPDRPDLDALLALMLLQHSRRDARTNAQGQVVLLPKQDRGRWRQEEIAEALELLRPLPARSITIEGRGSAELRYRRLPGNGTALRFRCPRCGSGTWLVETSRPWPLSGGPLVHPQDYGYVLDTVDVGPRNSVLVKSRPTATWSLTLTPFAAMDIADPRVQGRDSMVLRIRTAQPLTLRCTAPAFAKTFYARSGTSPGMGGPFGAALVRGG